MNAQYLRRPLDLRDEEHVIEKEDVNLDHFRGLYKDVAHAKHYTRIVVLPLKQT